MTKEEYNTADALIQTLIDSDDVEQLGIVAKRLLRAVYDDSIRWEGMTKYHQKQENAMNSAVHVHVHGHVE